jgi:transposase InsO family protein
MARDGVPVTPEFAALVSRYVEGERFNVRAQCALIGCSTTKFYKYARRFAERGVDGLYPDSRRPLTSPQSTTVAVEDLVLAARKGLYGDGWDAGADSIGFQLQAWRDAVLTTGDDGLERCGLLLVEHAVQAGAWPQGVSVPSRATINRILDRRGQLVAVPQRRPKTASRRFEADQPNTRWQMDGFLVDLADSTTVCVLHIVDDCSRMDIALEAVRSENSIDVWAVVQRAAQRYGLPAEMLTDNGTAFSGFRRGWISALTENLTALGVRHITSSVAHPQTCGKCERAHRTCRQWLDKQALHASIADLNGALGLYRSLHNNNRRRRHLHGMTPAQRYRLGPLDGPTDHAPGPVMITTKPVAPNGTIAIDRVSLGIGRAYAGQSVSVIRQDLTIIHNERLIAEAVLKRGIRYQSANQNGTKVSAKS